MSDTTDSVAWMWNRATSVAMSCVDASVAIPCTIVHTAARAGDTTVTSVSWIYHWATSMTMSCINASVAIPVKVVQTIIG